MWLCDEGSAAPLPTNLALGAAASHIPSKATARAWQTQPLNMRSRGSKSSTIYGAVSHVIASRSKAGPGQGSLAPCAALDRSEGCGMRCLGSCSVQEVKGREESGPENEGTCKSETLLPTTTAGLGLGYEL